MMQVIIDALSNGGLYGLAALGVGLVFGVMRLINFAHGELITCAAYLLVVCLRFGTMMNDSEKATWRNSLVIT